MSAPFPYAGEITSLLAAVSWALAVAIYRRYGEGVPAYLLTLFKSGFALPFFLLGSIAFALEGAVAPPSVWATLVISGTIGIAVGDTALFAGMKRLGTQLTAASFCLSPPFSLAIAYFFLGEKVEGFQLVGIIVSVIAVLGLAFESTPEHIRKTQPPGARTKGWLLLVASQFANSIGIVLSRDALPHIDVFSGTLARTIPSFLVLILLHRQQKKRLPSKSIWKKETFLALSAASFVGAVMGLVFMSAGIKFTKAGVAAALNATYPIWTLPLSAFWLKEGLNAYRTFLTLLAVLGTILMFLN